MPNVLNVATPQTKDEYVNGVKVAISILETYPDDKREKILNSIAVKAPTLIQKFHEEHFSFTDIKDLDDKSIQIIATRANHNDLKNLKDISPNQIFDAQKSILLLIDSLRKSGLARFSKNADGITI